MRQSYPQRDSLIQDRHPVRTPGVTPRLFFAVAVALALGACGDTEKSEKSDAAVRIVSFQFTPMTLRAEPGTTVTWTNEDTAVHSIKDTSPLATPASRDLGKRDTFSITYERPGSYGYICGIHQYMTGSVTVGG
jgi:plastocyanin